MGVEGDSADGAVRTTCVRSNPSLSDRLELCSTIVSVEIMVRYQLHPLLECKLLGSCADEHHMRCLLHDVPRQLHRVLYASDTRNRTCFLIAAIHDRSIELRCSIAREPCPSSRVEQRIILQHLHGDSDRIETGTTAIEYVEPGIEDAPETRFEVSARMRSETARNNARTRMNDQGMNEPSPRSEIDHTANSGACVLRCLRRRFEIDAGACYIVGTWSTRFVFAAEYVDRT